MKPKFAENWSCDKPIEDNKVPKKTRCEIVCPDGYDLKNGKNIFTFSQFSGCKSEIFSAPSDNLVSDFSFLSQETKFSRLP